MAFKILGVNGSLREGSFGRRGLNVILEVARGRGAETRLLDLLAADLPMFRPDEPGEPAKVKTVAEAVRWADALVLASPDYHGSVSGAMKNFLDYHWAEFAGKLFGYVCASHEKGLTVMDQMRTAVRQCYGWSLPYGASVHGEKDFDEAGTITNQRLADRLRMLARDLMVYGAMMREQFHRDLSGGEAATFAAHYGE